MIKQLFKAGLTASLLLTALSGIGLSDELSGPGRQSVSNESWGSVYYVPMELRDYSYHRDVTANLRLIKTGHGEVRITDNGLSHYEFQFPDGKASIDSVGQTTKVTFHGKNYEFVHKADGFVVKTPDDEIHYKFGPHTIVATGKRGTTKVTEKDGDYKVESPVGVYTYTPTGADGGFTVKGGPLARHPYMLRGALFEDSGVGFFVDFKKLDPDSLLFKFLEWSPLLEIRDHSKHHGV
jgi:hypothetical protein